MMEKSKSQVIELLHRSFLVDSIPLHIVDRGDETSEGRLVRTFFEGKNWRVISLQSLQHDYAGDASACLWFMTPESVAYYLPAYLAICVQDFQGADMISVTTVSRLRESAEGVRNNITAGINKLGEQENKAIAKVLQYVAEDDEAMDPGGEASAALQLRWKNFL